MPISFALAKAASRLAELPLVETPISAVARPGLRHDLAQEDLLEADIVADRGEHRDIGGEIYRGERRPAGGDRMRNSTATCAASQLDPPLPMVNRRPSRR